MYLYCSNQHRDFVLSVQREPKQKSWRRICQLFVCMRGALFAQGCVLMKFPSSVSQAKPKPSRAGSPSSTQTGTLNAWALGVWTRSSPTSSGEPSPLESSHPRLWNRWVRPLLPSSHPLSLVSDFPLLFVFCFRVISLRYVKGCITVSQTNLTIVLIS